MPASSVDKWEDRVHHDPDAWDKTWQPVEDSPTVRVADFAQSMNYFILFFVDGMSLLGNNRLKTSCWHHPFDMYSFIARRHLLCRCHVYVGTSRRISAWNHHHQYCVLWPVGCSACPARPCNESPTAKPKTKQGKHTFLLLNR